MLGSVLGAASGVLEGLYREASRGLGTKSSSADAAEEERAAPPAARPPLAPTTSAPANNGGGRSKRRSHDDDANVARLLPIVLLGDSGIGKTRAVRAWAAAAAAGGGEEKNDENADDRGEKGAATAGATVGADPFLKTMTLPDRRRVAVALWDVGGEGEGGAAEAGGERGREAEEAAERVCSSLGRDFFAGASAIVLAYDSDCSSPSRVEESLGRWLAAASERAKVPVSTSSSSGPEGARSLPPVVVVGLRRGEREGGGDRTKADEAAARWAASSGASGHFSDLDGALSVATPLALDFVAPRSGGGASSAAAAAAAARSNAWGASDTASDAADVLGSLACLGGARRG